MRANKQKSIKVDKSGFKRSRFNWSHDVNTTFAWGEIQPTQCKMLIPGSKTTMQAQNLIRLAPMVAPTFGRVKFKTFNQFVGFSEIMPNFAALMAQEPVSKGIYTRVPQEVPSVILGQLSTWVLTGARATLYWVDTSLNATQADIAATQGLYRTTYRRYSADGSTEMLDSQATEIFGAIQNTGTFDVGLNAITLGENRVKIKPKSMESLWSPIYQNVGIRDDYTIVLGNKTLHSLIPLDRSYDLSDPRPVIQDELRDDTFAEITPEAADYFIEFRIQENGKTYHLALAFECSDFGKRIRKVFQGVGYQIDFASTERVSILPLLAQYKAYFDIFGLQLYQGWETTYAAKLIQVIDQNFVGLMESNSTISANATLNIPIMLPVSDVHQDNYWFIDFLLKEIANEWYTEDTDYVSAHMTKLAVSPQPDVSGFISVDANGVDIGAHLSSGTSTEPDYTSDGQNSQTNPNTLIMNSNASVHKYIDQIQHGQVDAELLMRTYRWINRNTILGREIAKILRAQGLGKYVDECKSNYIGSSDVMVTISDVVSMADTNIDPNDPAAGRLLGEYGGKGLQYESTDTLVFENDEYGYWITLATVVPESGYTQGIDPTLKVLNKMNFYNADFDAIGMEMTTKDTIVGCRYVMCPGVIQNQSFGFIPRYSKFKVCQNLVNGDFNRHNLRDVYLPYTLDKQLSVNDYREDPYEGYTQASAGAFSRNLIKVSRSTTTNRLPVAGNVWRTPTKYAWLGNFNRIFANVGERDDEFVEDTSQDTNALDFVVGFSDYNNDNFLGHSIYDVQCYAPMKPIEESYGLDEDDPNRVGSDYVEKA